MAVTGSKDGVVRILQEATGKELARVPNVGAVTTLIFSADGSLAAAGTDKGETTVFEAATGHETARTGHESAVLALALNSDQTRIASGHADGMLRVCEARGGREIFEANAGGLPVRAIEFSKDGRLVIAGGDDRVVHVWDAGTGRDLSRYNLGASVRAAALKPFGDLALVGGADGTVALFRTDNGREEARIPGNGQLVTLAFSHDGKLFATGSSVKMGDGSNGGLTRLFDTDSNRELAHLSHRDAVRGVVFSPDDRSVATTDENHLIQVFRAVDGKKTASIDGDFVKTVRFSNDGASLRVISAEAIGSLESNVISFQRHPLETQDLVVEGCSRLAHNFSPDEWLSYFHNQRYRKTCPALP
jgi:WD40 repeat protein